MKKIKILRKDDGKYYFQFVASNGHIMGESLSYESKDRCMEDLEYFAEQFDENRQLKKLPRKNNLTRYYAFYNRNNKFVAKTKLYYTRKAALNCYFIILNILRDCKIDDLTLTETEPDL